MYEDYMLLMVTERPRMSNRKYENFSTFFQFFSRMQTLYGLDVELRCRVGFDFKYSVSKVNRRVVALSDSGVHLCGAVLWCLDQQSGTDF